MNMGRCILYMPAFWGACLLLASQRDLSASGVLLAEPIQPVPLSLHQNPARAALGRQLFYDVRLSANNRVSCASCHNLARGGVDGLAHSPGVRGQLTDVNTPTVYNAALNFRQFWDGRAPSLEAQVAQVVQNPTEMGSSWPDVVRKLSQDPLLRSRFSAQYPDGITAANIQQALATFERTLITPDSRFDRYLRGDSNAITAQEKAGYAKFKQFGCVACHQGVNVGGNMYQKFGVLGDYFAQRGTPPGKADWGRFGVTAREEDRHVFKVPGLRNVVLTAPYLHDGSAKTLEAAIDVMFQYQLGRIGTREDKQAIIQFLHTLSATPGATP